MIDTTALLAATLDLESGHPIEAVVQAHGFDRYSAYEVVTKYEKRVTYLNGAITEEWRRYWQGAVDEIWPCVDAIANALGIPFRT